MGKENRIFNVIIFITLLVLLSATAYFRNITWKNAVTLQKDVVIKSPKKGRGHENLGLAYYDKGKLDKAITQNLTASMFISDHVKIHNNLGLSYYSLGMTDEAINEYLLALNLNPDKANAYNNLGVVYSRQGMFDEAIEEYLTVLRLKPDDIDAYYNLGGMSIR